MKVVQSTFVSSIRTSIKQDIDRVSRTEAPALWARTSSVKNSQSLARVTVAETKEMTFSKLLLLLLAAAAAFTSVQSR